MNADEIRAALAAAMLTARAEAAEQAVQRVRCLAEYWAESGNSWRKGAARQFLRALDGGEQLMPQRIQRKRTKGWRTPLCTCGCGKPAIYVGRPTVWGNPFRLRDQSSGLVHYGPKHAERFGRAWDYEGRISADGASHHMWFAADDVVETYVRWATRAELVELYRLTLTRPTPGMLMAYPSAGGYFASVTPADIRANLAGHDLACWCPLDQPCHADVLLELANGGAS